MYPNNQRIKTETECIEIISSIFKEASSFYNEIAPNGLKDSPYVLFLHPTAEQQFEENKVFFNNIKKLKKNKDAEEKEYQLSDFKQDDLKNINEYEEFIYILGLAVYDIFSNNHSVIGEDHKIYDLGSMRGSGGFIADFLNLNYPRLEGVYDYMDFYMGAIWIEKRGNLIPFYEYIFKKIRLLNCDWEYSFPQLYVVSPTKINEVDELSKMEAYNPEKAMLEELEQINRDNELQKLQEELDEIHQMEFEEAKYKPLVPLVQAYYNIFGCLPEGHPQKNI